MTTFTKADQRAMDRAISTNNADYIGRTAAIISRSGSKRSQDAVNHYIEHFLNWSDFTLVNGALLHNSETTK